MKPLAAVCLWLALATASRADVPVESLQVEGLFEGAAYLNVAGQSRLLRVGQSFAGVKLLAADPRRALVEVNGKQLELTLSERIGAHYRDDGVREVKLQRNRELKYLTSVEINGRRLNALVDTGANLVAMSAIHARQLGIDYQRGERATVSTASGLAAAYRVILPSVAVGDIVARQVPAVVIDGNYPEQLLLGMSYLDHVDMEEKDNILTLRARY